MAGGSKQVLLRRVYTVPISLGRRRVTMVARLGGGVCLAATWDFLGIFPSRTSGVAVRWDEEGRGGVSVPVSSRSIRRRDRSAGAPPSFQEQRSAASLDQSPKCSLLWQLQHQTGPPCGCGCKTKSPGAETNEVAPSGPHWKPGKPLLKCSCSPKNVMMALLSRTAFLPLAWKHKGH